MKIVFISIASALAGATTTIGFDALFNIPYNPNISAALIIPGVTATILTYNVLYSKYCKEKG